jgi:putative ABC transport system substrate-binding protein
LAKPGGNLTGVVVYGAEADIKRLEMVAEYFGQGKRIAYLVDATIGPESIRKIEQAAATLRVELAVFRAVSPSEYDAVFQAMQDAGVGALLFSRSMNFLVDRGNLAARAAAARLPTMCHWREMAHAGCLVSFGTNLEWVFGRVVEYLLRIMVFGEKPGDLPVEQASAFELIINMKTARTLGVTIPDGLAARANDVIE